MKRAATVDRTRKNASYQDSNPLLRDNRSKQGQRAFDAATEYFKKYKTPLTETLQSWFGAEFFARAALWLDPLAPFRNTAGLIGYENRLQEKVGFIHTGESFSIVHHRTSTNTIADEPDPVPEYIVEESDEDMVLYLNNNATTAVSYLMDSTRRSRDWENSWAEGERYDRNIPSFGTMRMHKFASTDYAPYQIIRTEEVVKHIYADGVIYPLIDRDIAISRFQWNGSITSPSGNPIFADPEEYALDVMNDNVSDMIAQASASRRTFNLAYQIGELRDLPRLLGDIGALQSLVKRYIEKPRASLANLDKDIASLNLAWEFGVKSLASAVKGLMMLPEKATKRLNYLIAKNGKVSSGRSKRQWLTDDLTQEPPTFEFILPSWITVSNEETVRKVSVELRCVVNQTIQFPVLAVPSLSDKDYRDQIGLSVNALLVKDIYDLVPFTWLVNWFSGLGAYVNVMTAIHSDRQLINYGFLTIVITEEFTHKADLNVLNTYREYYTDELSVEHDISVRNRAQVIPYVRVYTRKYQRRVDIGSLDGVKTFGWFQTNLSAFQIKILGSLTSQRL